MMILSCPDRLPLRFSILSKPLIEIGPQDFRISKNNKGSDRSHIELAAYGEEGDLDNISKYNKYHFF